MYQKKNCNLISIHICICVETIDPGSVIQYNELNEKIERISQLIYTLFVKITPAGIVLPGLFITLTNYFVYDLKEDSYYFTFPIMYAQAMFDSIQSKDFVVLTLLKFVLRHSIRTPFDWKTPFGYLITIIVAAIATFQNVSVIVPIVCFTVGSAMLASDLNQVVVNNLIIFNDLAKNSTKNFDESKKLLCSIIQDFSQGKQFSRNCFGSFSM